MVGLNKFFIFDQNKLNIVDDNAYQQSTYRVNGAVTGVAPSTIHNKLYYQSSIMASAIAQVVANRGLDAIDGDFDNLVAVLTSVIDNSITSRNWKALNAYNVGEVIYSEDIANSMKFFECTVAGTSGTTEPAWGAVGTTIADGTATWKVFDIRQGTTVGRVPTLVDVGGGVVGLPAIDASLLTGIASNPVGTILSVLTKNTPTGYLKVNGAAISRSTYANLVNNTFITIPTTGTKTNGSAIITAIPTTVDMAIGMKVEGAGIPSGATIASINSLTSITLSVSLTATETSGAVTVFPYGNGDGSTTVNLPDLRGEHLRSFDDGRNADTTVLTGITTLSSAVITGLSYTGFMFIGMPISGIGIPVGATVASITSATAITISANATVAGTDAQLIFTGRRFGSFETDTFQGHNHYISRLAIGGATVTVGVNNSTTTNASVSSLKGTAIPTGSPLVGFMGTAITDDTVNGTPRIGAETRGRNYAIPVYIKY